MFEQGVENQIANTTNKSPLEVKEMFEKHLLLSRENSLTEPLSLGNDDSNSNGEENDGNIVESSHVEDKIIHDGDDDTVDAVDAADAADGVEENLDGARDESHGDDDGDNNDDMIDKSYDDEVPPRIHATSSVASSDYDDQFTTYAPTVYSQDEDDYPEVDPKSPRTRRTLTASSSSNSLNLDKSNSVLPLTEDVRVVRASALDNDADISLGMHT